MNKHTGWLQDYTAAQAARDEVFPVTEVCACPCWPGHFDPCGVYFDDCDIVGNEPEPHDARPTVDFHE